MSLRTPRVSLIVPACNSAHDLEESLGALRASTYPNVELIVVDDASTDDTAAVAERMGAAVVRLSRNGGPSSARNLGARRASGDILFFVDADVVIAPGAVERVVATLESRPDVAAVFGSYDAHPTAPGLVSRYRNLLHHYVHQQGETNASTFWGACGAIRRSVFEAMSGFDEVRYPRCIEDIELGYRLRRAGHRILLDKGLQGTHRKRWTLGSMIRTDVCCRAIPWVRLILETKSAPDDLNLRDGQRVSVGLVGLAVASLPLAFVRLETLGLTALALLAVVVLNRRLYAFFLHQGGVRLAVAGAALHGLYFLYGGLAYAYAWFDCRLLGGARSFALSQGVRPARHAARMMTSQPAEPLAERQHLVGALPGPGAPGADRTTSTP